jgi:undecaprenyl diphosphate synthase
MDMPGGEKRIVPAHVAIIMDGNGRWAEARGKPRIEGHRQGAKSVDRITRASGRLGVKRLTLYAFSSENWKRPKREVSMLMTLLRDYLKRYKKELMENKVRLTAIGRIHMLPQRTRDALTRTMNETSANTGLNLCLALSYGGRDEIVDAARALAREVAKGHLQPDQIDEGLLSQHLYQPGPDPDLIIRTAGEMRLSNFLLWEASYAEFYSTPLCWPEFSEDDLEEAIAVYNERVRKYGGLIETGGKKDC